MFSKIIVAAVILQWACIINGQVVGGLGALSGGENVDMAHQGIETIVDRIQDGDQRQRFNNQDRMNERQNQNRQQNGDLEQRQGFNNRGHMDDRQHQHQNRQQNDNNSEKKQGYNNRNRMEKRQHQHENEHEQQNADYTYQLNFHVIPFDENEAKQWSERAEIPFDQVRRIMDLRKEAKETDSYTKKIEKIRDLCEYINSLSIDTNQLSHIDVDNDQEYSRNEKCWVDTSMRMAYYAEKVNNADNEREKLMLLKKVCMEMLS